MLRYALALLLMALGACQLGTNEGMATEEAARSVLEIMQEKVTTARKLVMLAEVHVENMRRLHESGRANEAALYEAETDVLEARLRLLGLQQELLASQAMLRR